VVPLLNRPFLAYQLALLGAHGVTDVVLACSYRVEDVEAALGDGRAFGTRLRYVVEREPLGTGGGVRNAADLVDGTIVVLNGDVLTDADLSAMRAFHEARDSRATILLARVADPSAYGLVETAADGRLQRFREKPGRDEPRTADTINAGIYLLDAALLRRIAAGRAVSIEREFFPALVADGVPCHGWLGLAAYWRDIGSAVAYREAQMDLLDGRVRTALAPPGTARDGCWLDDGARVAGARLVPPAVVGAGVVVEPGAQVGPRAVVGAGCRIGAGARVDGAVLWERVEVGPGAVLRDCVVAAGCRIGARAEIGPGVVLEADAVVTGHATIGR
jgi:NDP-sugar pyrophosphorylase family protein